jgi:hypothetical protein
MIFCFGFEQKKLDPKLKRFWFSNRMKNERMCISRVKRVFALVISSLDLALPD